MKPLQNSYIPIALVIIMTLVSGCQSGKKDSPLLIEDVDELASSEGLSSLSQIYHLYPSPAEMLSVIDMTDMIYDGSLLNPTERADQYLDSKKKTQALGIYMTDLAYAALFGRHEETLDYLETSKMLAEDININEAVDDALIKKARDNVDYLDSLYVISNDVFINILRFCEKDKRSNTVVMLSAGAFIESMYLAINMIDDYAEADLLLQHLADQKFTFDNFMLFAISVKSDDPGVTSTIKDLEKIKNIYDGIKAGTGKVTIKAASETDANQPKKLVISGADSASQPRLTEDEFNALRAAIIEIRNNAVKVN